MQWLRAVLRTLFPGVSVYTTLTVEESKQLPCGHDDEAREVIRCPHCAGPLVAREVGQVLHVECGKCHCGFQIVRQQP